MQPFQINEPQINERTVKQAYYLLLAVLKDEGLQEADAQEWWDEGILFTVVVPYLNHMAITFDRGLRAIVKQENLTNHECSAVEATVALARDIDTIQAALRVCYEWRN